MAYCSNCGTKLEENAKFCLACGTPVEQTENTTNTTETASFATYTDPVPEKASGNLNVGQLVWSIINIVLCCCCPLGIVSLIMTISAKNASSAGEEAGKLKTAKICNLIATIVSAAFCIIYIAYFILLFIIGSMM